MTSEVACAIQYIRSLILRRFFNEKINTKNIKMLTYPKCGLPFFALKNKRDIKKFVKIY